MNEIEKLMQNAGIKKVRYCEVEEECPSLFGHRCEDCDLKPKPECYTYPPFTAEKQLELIKWLIQEVNYLQLQYFGGKEYFFAFDLGATVAMGGTFEETIARLINNIWQSLTEQEKTSIKNILEM